MNAKLAKFCRHMVTTHQDGATFRDVEYEPMVPMLATPRDVLLGWKLDAPIFHGHAKLAKGCGRYIYHTYKRILAK